MEAVAPAVAVHPRARARTNYFAGPVIDPLLLGGISIGLYVLCRSFPDFADSPGFFSAASFLVWIVNWPHFAATNYRLYRSSDTRRQFPMTANVLPFVMFGFLIMAWLSPSVFAPLMVKLYLLWSPYHFSGQTVGISMLYARRSKYTLSTLQRRALIGFILLTYMFTAARAETSIAARNFHAVRVPSLGIPQWFPAFLSRCMWLLATVFVIETLRLTVVNRRMVPFMVVLPAVTQCVWFVGPFAGNFKALVPMFHSLQYLFIAWVVSLYEGAPRGALTEGRRAWRAFGHRTAHYALFSFLGGVVLFWAAPRIGALFGRSFGFSSAVVLAVVQLHHFFVDGVVWRLKSAGALSPLDGSIGDFLRKEPAAIPIPAAAAP